MIRYVSPLWFALPMAAAWYRSIAGSEAREDVIARLMERDYDDEALMQHYLAWRRNG